MTLWVTLIICGVGTFVLRFSFIALQGRLKPGPRIQKGLRFVPVAALTALIVPATLMDSGSLHPDFVARTLAAVVAGVVAWRTKNALVTIAVGLIVFWAALFVRVTWLTH